MKRVTNSNSDHLFDPQMRERRSGFSNYLVDEIRNAIDLISFLEDEYGLILEEGSNGWSQTNCPLPGHRDSTPSFGVNNESGLFHCFGCNETGDVFKFVCKVEGVSFPEAVARLQILSGISDNPDEGETLRALREMQLVTDEYLKRQAEYDLPGGMSPVQFMRSLSDRLRVHEAKTHGDADEIEWVDSVYHLADALDTKEDYRGLTKLWNGVGKTIKEHYALWRERHEDNAEDNA